MVSETYKCVLRGEEDGTLTARLFSWYEGLTSCRGLALALKTGENPYALLRDCCREALKALNNGCAPREEREYPEIFEYLGWCSWDALQIRVDEAGLLEKCREFQQKGIPVRWAIIDDMWAEVHSFYGAKYDSFDQMVELMHQSPLYEFEGDPKRFPHKLAGCIERMKAFGLKVGIWHPTTGYWFGIDPEGPLFQRLKDCLIQAPGRPLGSQPGAGQGLFLLSRAASISEKERRGLPENRQPEHEPPVLPGCDASGAGGPEPAYGPRSLLRNLFRQPAHQLHGHGQRRPVEPSLQRGFPVQRRFSAR